jgi:hypothetical protein
MNSKQNRIYVDVVIRLELEPDADPQAVASEMNYSFDHPQIIDHSIEDVIEPQPNFTCIAAELRRLHEENQMMRNALQTIANIALMDHGHWAKTIEAEALAASRGHN